MTGGTTNCIQAGCGGTADMMDGEYDLLNNVIHAFSAPGMTRNKVAAVERIARDLAARKISQDQAKAQADDLNQGLSQIFVAAARYGVTLDTLLAVIALVLAFYNQFAPDADIESLTKATQQQTEISQRILEELQRQRISNKIRTPEQQPKVQQPPQRPLGGNRADRRKNASIKRRKAQKNN